MMFPDEAHAHWKPVLGLVLIPSTGQSTALFSHSTTHMGVQGKYEDN